MDDQDDREYSRAPGPEDLVKLCEALNREAARYVLIGGFAIIAHGLERPTKDIDLLIEASSARLRRQRDPLRRDSGERLAAAPASGCRKSEAGCGGERLAGEYWTKFEPPRSRELILKLVQPEGGLANLRTGTLPVAGCQDDFRWLCRTA